jgi:streptogramin lyase
MYQPKVFRIITWLLISTIQCYPALAQDDYTIRVFTVQDSLAQNYVNTIIQDTRGFLWIGTGEGLSRYDGKQIVNFRRAEGLADDFITVSSSDNIGNLYFGHLNGDISIYTGFRFITIKTGIHSKVTGLDFDEDTDAVWGVCQNGKLFQIKSNQISLLTPQITQEKIINCLKAVGGKLWIGSNEGLVWIIPGDNSISSEGSIENLDYINVTALHERKNKGSLWASTEDNGIFKIENENSQKLNVSGLDSLYITQVLEDEQDNLWIATKLSGIIKISFDSKFEKSIGHVLFKGENSIQSPSVLLEDQEKNVWAGSLGEGLVQYIPDQFTFYDIHKFSGAKEAGPGVQISKTEYWFGTDLGIIRGNYIETERKFAWTLNPPIELKNTRPVTMFKIPDDSLIWIGDNEQQVFVYNLNKKKLHLPKGLEKGRLNSAARAKDGTTWLAIEGHGVYQLDKDYNQIKHLNTTNGMLHNSISSICADRSNNIWFGSKATGLFKLLANEDFEYWTKDELFPSYSVNDIKEDTEGNIWVATDGDGLFKIGLDSIYNFTSANGLTSNFCKQLICDTHGNIWVSHRSGISNLNTEANAIRTYGNAHKLKSITDENTMFFEDLSGDIWFSEEGRIIRYNARFDNPDYFSRKVNFTNLRLFYKNIDLLTYKDKNIVTDFDLFPVKLPFDQNHITIDFVAVSLREKNSINYRHRLVELENEWSPFNQDTYVTYTNLKPGKYTLEVSASANTTSWNGPISRYSFTILRPYWGQWWFYALEAMLLITLFLIIYFVSNKRENTSYRAGRWLVYIFVFIVLDFILVYIEPYLEKYNNGVPIFKVIINLCLALALLPIENILKKFLTGRPIKSAP